MPALAHSTAYIGLSSIRTLAPSSLQHGPMAAVTVNIADKAKCTESYTYTSLKETRASIHIVILQAVAINCWNVSSVMLSRKLLSCLQAGKLTCRSLTSIWTGLLVPSDCQSGLLQRCQDSAAQANLMLAFGSHAVWT